MYGSKEKQPSLFRPDGKDIIPLQYDKAKLAGTAVFGYLPDWEYNNRGYLKYNLLTHIAAFDFPVDSMGNMTNPSYWPWTDIINTAHTNGVKIILTAVNFAPAQIRNIMSNNTAKQNFIRAVKSRIGQYQLDGVNVDFESLYSSDRGSLLNTFLKELSDSVKASYPNAEISFAGPALTSGYSILGLIGSVDYVFIMGYSFYGSWSTTTGACAPMYGSLSIENTVNVQYANALQFPSKLILGVPYYGLKWTTQNEQPNTTVLSYVSSTRFSTDALNAPFYGRLWSSNMGVPWYRFQANNVWNQVWYDDDTSLGLKWGLAQQKGFRGIGMWALCYDGARPEYWNEIQRRFFTTGITEKTPEKDVTVSVYPQPASGNVFLKSAESGMDAASVQVYSSLGKELRVSIMRATEYEAEINSTSLSSGVYFIRLQLNGKYRILPFVIRK